MESEQFSKLVDEAVQSLPDEFLEHLDNIDVLVADAPTAAQLRRGKVGRHGLLLGLYEGVPQTRRTSGYNMVLPDKITIFRQSIESMCKSDDEIHKLVQHVVLHEIAHHFGIGDERLRELGKY
ncbi:MAG TPA: metallopeptidase family protein [Dehalococcoidales bacterium]|nr:metallopeptidase family protein [Dehalococcoidales bacterium]